MHPHKSTFLHITILVIFAGKDVLMNYESLLGLSALVSAIASLIWSVRRKA